MDELEKALAIALSGPLADDALARCRAVLADWQVALPPSEPLVLDFGLGRFERTGLTEFWIANETQAGYCGKYLFVFDGQTCPAHRHGGKHETFFIVKGRARMTLDGAERELSEGDVRPVPPGHVHSFTGIGPCLLLELSTPCLIDDNQFEDARIPIGRRS
jgi:mannose-6-phosphate isomerase-like protein (cupin superfamily)